MIIRGAGKDPDLSSKAKSVADWNVKFPVITLLPPIIGSLITGALIILLSKIIANLFPTLFVVTLANFLVPDLSKVRFTVAWLSWLSKNGLALIKLFPLNTTLLLILNCDSRFSKNRNSEHLGQVVQLRSYRYPFL